MVAVLTSFCLVFATWPPGWVQADKKDELNEKLDEIQEKKKEKEEDIQKLKSKIEKRKEKLSEAENQLEKTEKKMDKVEKRLKEAQKTLDRYNDEFKNSIRSMYMNSSMNRMESLVTADSFDQFLARFEIMRLIVKRDYKIVEEYYEEKQKVKEEKDDLEKLTKKQEKEAEKAQKAYDELTEEMNKNKSALAELSHEEGDTKKELQKLDLSNLKSGNFAYQGPLSRPVNGPMTSGYGYRDSEFHTGIDYANSIGTPIHAAANGKVIRSRSCSCGYGYYIMIDHGGGVFSLYAHMWSTTVRVRTGDVVKRGQQIAAIGNNGRSTGPHLHFEVHKGSPGNYVNPVNYMR
ncbi:hypothetical protein CHM34_01890 [Paludifilum halophilum]|uniref:Uncharacterized protein n=1 Tax=Paludifilum halophilum TaxID=1642702 RepID=A0A235BCK2_9BACL|nr:hypothetical protein CHM34_01890 [Paludifilum halophilum]